MTRFHDVMRKVRAKLLYGERELLVGLKEVKLSDAIEVGNALVEEFGVTLDDITIRIHDSHVTLVLPFNAEEESEVKDDGEWVRITDSAAYKVEDGKVRIGYLKDGKYQTLATFNMSDLVELFDELPDKFTRDDVFKAAKNLKLEIPYSTITYLMHFFSRHPYFDAELEKDGRQLVLVKNSYHLGKENRAKMEIEKETIGTPWKA